MAIFSSPSMLKTQADKLKYGYVKFDKDQSSYFLRSPLLGISITEAVDYNINKTLDGNFNILTFEDHPVIIQLSGLQCIAIASCSKGKLETNKNMQSAMSKFYSNYKLSKKESNSPTVSITIADSTYQAVILSLKRESNANFPGMMDYSMILYGAKKANV